MKRGAAIFLITASILIALRGARAAAQEPPCGGERIIKTVTGTITTIGHPRAGIMVTMHATDGITYAFGIENACVLGTTAERLKPGDEIRVSFYDLTQDYPPTYGNPVSVALLGPAPSAMPTPGESGGAENRSPRTMAEGIPPNTIILDDFNPSMHGRPYGIAYVRTPYGQGALFSQDADSRIEYPQGIPAQGTLEWWIKVNSGFYYDNYQLHSDRPNAMIFSTDAHGGDVTWPGTAKLFVYANGEVSLYIAISKYDRPLSRSLVAYGTPFRFNQWNSIGISYGNQGEYIMVDGQLVASAPDLTQPLGAAGNHLEPLDVPTIGETLSHFWAPHQYSGGFDGVVARFRASDAQRDWVLSAARPGAGASARPATAPACSGATDAGYSLTFNGATYRVQVVTDAGGKHVPIFLDSHGNPVRGGQPLLEELERAAWTRGNIIASHATRVELAQKDIILNNAIDTLQAVSNYQTVQDLLARAAVTALEATVTGGTSLPAGLAQLRAGELVHQLEDSPRTFLTLTAEEGLARSRTLYDELEQKMYPADATTLDAARLGEIYAVFMRAHTLELPNEALAAALSPTHANQLTQAALSSVVSQALVTLGPINPNAAVTAILLLKTQQALATAAATLPALKGYQTNLNLALYLAAVYQKQIRGWVSEAIHTCRVPSGPHASPPSNEAILGKWYPVSASPPPAAGNVAYEFFAGGRVRKIVYINPLFQGGREGTEICCEDDGYYDIKGKTLTIRIVKNEETFLAAQLQQDRLVLKQQFGSFVSPSIEYARSPSPGYPPFGAHGTISVRFDWPTR